MKQSILIIALTLLIFAGCSTSDQPENSSTSNQSVKASSQSYDSINADTIFLGAAISRNYALPPFSVTKIPISFNKTDGCFKGLTFYVVDWPNGSKIDCQGVLYPYGELSVTDPVNKSTHWVRQYMDVLNNDWRPIVLSSAKVNQVNFYMKNYGNKSFSVTFKTVDGPITGTTCN